MVSQRIKDKEIKEDYVDVVKKKLGALSTKTFTRKFKIRLKVAKLITGFL